MHVYHVYIAYRALHCMCSNYSNTHTGAGYRRREFPRDARDQGADEAGQVPSEVSLCP